MDNYVSHLSNQITDRDIHTLVSDLLKLETTEARHVASTVDGLASSVAYSENEMRERIATIRRELDETEARLDSHGAVNGCGILQDTGLRLDMAAGKLDVLLRPLAESLKAAKTLLNETN